jgi:hypothetical protein
MLTFSSDFWPLFWTITGGAALLVVALTALVAFIPGRRAAAPPRLVAVNPAGEPEATRLPRAA